MSPNNLFLTEYLQNTRALLHKNYSVFHLSIERQVQFQVLPRLVGNRASLEPHLWDLLVLCLDGHEVTAPPLQDTQWNLAKTAVAQQTALLSEKRATYPKAAAAVLKAIETLRAVGVLPPPKLGTAEKPL